MDSQFTVFLDRDGVINRKLPHGRFVCRWDEFEILPGVPRAIRLLNQNRVTTIVVTNQRGISLGLYSEKDLSELHKKMACALKRQGASLNAIYYCPHAAGVCDCRKPGVALFRQALRDFPSADALRSVLVGDSLGDLEAAQQLGCKKVLIRDSDGIVEAAARKLGIDVEYCADSLLDAVEKYILPGFSSWLPADG
jgi:D-glycero-D-manno-heptose 1,7-bisphosphate phosphatase